MDKKDLKGMLKFFTIIYFTMIAGVGTLGNFFVACIYALTNGGGFFENFWSNTVTLFTAFFYLTLVIYTGIVVAGLMLKVRRKSEMVESKDYVRDLPEYFPPAIASFLLDLSIETTDYTATIAYLIAKGYITIDKDDKVTLNKDSILNLAKHERYVLQAVLGNNKYNHEDFKRYVVEDAEKMGYIKKERRKTNFLRNFTLDIIVCMTCMMFADSMKVGLLKTMLEIIGVITGYGIFFIIGYSIYLLTKFEGENFVRTKLGTEEAKKWTGIKNYIKDYTLLSNKNIKDTTLFEEYIAYAISLNEAKTIEKYVMENKKYRRLIYGEVYNFMDKM